MKLLVMFLVSLESSQQGGVLAGHVTNFKPMEQKLLRNQLRSHETPCYAFGIIRKPSKIS